MPAAEPTIVATSGGIVQGTATRWEFGPLAHLAVELARVPTNRPSRVCFLPTAQGDSSFAVRSFYDAAQLAGFAGSHLALIPMPNVADIREFLLGQDVIWVGGGSVSALLAIWRLHGLDSVLQEVWMRGIVLTGISAGSICWHVGGPTDSFGPTLRNESAALGFIPYSNAVHYDTDPQRRLKFHQLIASGELPEGYATDDGAGLVYQEKILREAVTEIAGSRAYAVTRNEAGQALEVALPTRLLT